MKGVMVLHWVGIVDSVLYLVNYVKNLAKYRQNRDLRGKFWMFVNEFPLVVNFKVNHVTGFEFELV
jgi:hypothetical protein